jgi:hypothetical protein
MFSRRAGRFAGGLDGLELIAYVRRLWDDTYRILDGLLQELAAERARSAPATRRRPRRGRRRAEAPARYRSPRSTDSIRDRRRRGDGALRACPGSRSTNNRGMRSRAVCRARAGRRGRERPFPIVECWRGGSMLPSFLGAMATLFISYPTRLSGSNLIG